VAQLRRWIEGSDDAENFGSDDSENFSSDGKKNKISTTSIDSDCAHLLLPLVVEWVLHLNVSPIKLNLDTNNNTLEEEWAPPVLASLFRYSKTVHAACSTMRRFLNENEQLKSILVHNKQSPGKIPTTPKPSIKSSSIALTKAEESVPLPPSPPNKKKLVSTKITWLARLLVVVGVGASFAAQWSIDLPEWASDIFV